MAKIIIRIPKAATLALKPSSGPRVEVDGVVGTSCTEVTKGITEALGNRETQELKPEFYQAETPQIPVQEENPQDDG